ncbi:TPA: type VI secretion system tip protein VgrG [Escherichia coli]|nr:type VI secretion system tip protein VgrG [Escherichia coli]
MSLKGLRFTLEVDGQEPDTFAVVSFRLIQSQSYPFVMSVDVASDSFMQTAEMLLEKNATLTIWQGVIPQRYVTGVVAGFGMQENNGWQMRYHLCIEPPLWRCGLRQNFRIFQQQDIRTISATLLNENDEQHGKDFTLYQMDSLRSDAEKATGQSNSPRLWPGTRFTLTGHPQKMLNREWQVIQSILSGDQPQALHGSQGRGTTLGNQLEVIPADRTWRPRVHSKPKVDGPQSAIVTGPAGEEIFCDEHGRVRVKFHWDRYHGMTEESSCWVRVSQAWAGPGFGNLAIPRVGQEVIVDFLNGDPDQPLVMGRTYHEDNRSPGDLPGTKTQMTIRSKTYKGSGFNELRFEDATSNEQVYIHAQKNMDTEVLNDRTTDVKHDHTETIGNDQKITVGLGQTVNVGSKKEGGHDQKVTVANDQTITVQNDQRLDVTHDRHKDVGNDQISKIIGKDTEEVVKSQDIKVGEDYSLTVTNSLTIKVGECLLKMNKDGTIILNGKSIQIEGKDKINIFGADIDLD